jgi:hypothetical protein
MKSSLAEARLMRVRSLVRARLYLGVAIRVLVLMLCVAGLALLVVRTLDKPRDEDDGPVSPIPHQLQPAATQQPAAMQNEIREVAVPASRTRAGRGAAECSVATAPTAASAVRMALEAAPRAGA